MWPIGPSLILWKEGDLVKVCSAPWHPGVPGIILKITSQPGYSHNQWYDVLVAGKVESLMHLDFEPFSMFQCKNRTYIV